MPEERVAALEVHPVDGVVHGPHERREAPDEQLCESEQRLRILRADGRELLGREAHDDAVGARARREERRLVAQDGDRADVLAGVRHEHALLHPSAIIRKDKHL